MLCPHKIGAVPLCTCNSCGSQLTGMHMAQDDGLRMGCAIGAGHARQVSHGRTVFAPVAAPAAPFFGACLCCLCRPPFCLLDLCLLPFFWVAASA